MSVISVHTPQTAANMPSVMLREVLKWTADPTTAVVCRAWNRNMKLLYKSLLADYAKDPVFRSYIASYIDTNHLDALLSPKARVHYIAQRVREMAKPMHIRLGVKEIAPLDLPSIITGIEDANLCQVFQELLPGLLKYALHFGKLRTSLSQFVTQAAQDSFNPIPLSLAQKALNIRTWFKQNKDLLASTGRTLNLSLKNLNLTTLPPELCLLPESNFLDLEHNALTQLPPFFTRLTERTQELYLSQNRLTHLPSDIGSLLNLDAFEAHHNRLTDLPASFSDLDQLQALDLSHNRFSDDRIKALREGLPYITDRYEDNPDSFVLDPQDVPVEVARIEREESGKRARESGG